MHDIRRCVKKSFVPIGSLIDNGSMGRPKNFNREGVLEKLAFRRLKKELANDLDLRSATINE
jgi:hypothetical protein